METTLYKITFQDGREYRVFCGNKAQKKRFYKMVETLKDYETLEELTNGIHTIKQWEEIINNE